MINKPSLQSSRSAVAGASRLLAASLLAIAPVSAATILNPSFESPDINSSYPGWNATNSLVIFNAPPTAAPAGFNWTIVGGAGTDIAMFDNASGYLATAGSQFLDLTGGTNAYGLGVSQGSITVVPGTPYTLNFDVGGFKYKGNDLGTAAVALTIGGGHTYSGNFLNSQTRPIANGIVWQTMAYNFTPTTSSISLQFVGANVGGSSLSGIAFDNVTLTPVPEPAGVGTLLVGLGMFGFAARRRRSHLSA
jgi:hypothetical protein